MQEKTKEIVLNSKIKDSGSKIIFDDNVLCSQFLRDYIDLPFFKEISPEDIEDVTEQFVPLFAEERNADRVKKVHIKSGMPFFLVSLIEHKTKIDYNVSMQIFRYMIYIWDAYEKEADRLHPGISKRADFKYPPILPIVYYEGSAAWTVPVNFKNRIVEGEKFGSYVPDFCYYLVPLRDYSNEELIAKKDEISLVMLINKMQTKEDIENFRKLPADKVEAILKDSPKHLVDIIANILLAFLLKENVPIVEAEELVDKVKEKKMAELFENMEPMDIQAERRKTEEQRRKTEEERRKTEEQRRKTEEQRRRAEKAEADLEKVICAFIEMCREFSMTKEATIQKAVEKFDINEKEASEKVGKYWKK